MRIFGLVGYPLSHSFSRNYFSKKFEKENIVDGLYENFEVDTLDGFRARANSMKELSGLNVTIPYKERIIGLLDEANGIVKDIKACNCIKITGGKWIGHNTDVMAFKQSFEKGLQPNHTKALILGTGGASKAVAYALNQLGIELLFVSTTKKGTGIISYGDINRELLGSHNIIINTTPVGMFPDIANSPAINYDFLTSLHYLFDLVYNPEKTSFLSLGEQHGATIKNGYEMLQLQAEESWRIWNME